jgi:hypothetical protein
VAHEVPFFRALSCQRYILTNIAINSRIGVADRQKPAWHLYDETHAAMGRLLCRGDRLMLCVIDSVRGAGRYPVQATVLSDDNDQEQANNA